MKYQPKVTIIIPVYNGSDFLNEAINSALSQTYKNCEILVVNDGSTDNGKSESIALSYGEKIKYYSKDNGGVSSALNFAFKKINGEWFSWLSHDDLYYPEKIEKQICFINRLLEDDPQINLNKITIRSATESINKYGKIIKRPNYKNIQEKEKIIDTILNNISNYRLSGCSFLLPSSCVKDIGEFNEKIRTVSDVEYWYRLLFSGYQFFCLKNDVLVQNRNHGKQIGKTKKNLFKKELTDLFIWIADELNKNKTYSNIKNNEKLYYGFLKRNNKIAAKYVKIRYINSFVGRTKYFIKYSFYYFIFSIYGIFRTVAKRIYRKIFVK